MKAGPRCTVCTHPQRREVERAIVTGSFRTVAARFDVSTGALQRHKTNCQRNAVLARQERMADDRSGEATIETVAALVRRAQELISVAEVRAADGKLTRATDVKSAVAALGGAVKALQLQAQLRGEIKTGGDVNVLVDQRGKPREEWSELTSAIFAALRPYPEAARAVAAALSGPASAAPSSALVPHVPAQGGTTWNGSDVVDGEIV